MDPVNFQITMDLQMALEDQNDMVRVIEGNYSARCMAHMTTVASNVSYQGAMQEIARHMKLMHDPKAERRHYELAMDLPSGSSIIVTAWMTPEEQEKLGITSSVKDFARSVGAKVD